MKASASVRLPRHWRVRTGPRRWHYLLPFGVFVVGWFAFYLFGFSYQADRDAAAAELLRSPGDPVEIVVERDGTWSIWLDLHAGVEPGQELARALAGAEEWGVSVRDAAVEQSVMALRPGSGGSYLVLGDGAVRGRAIADVTLPPGNYVVTVQAAADKSDPAIAGFSLGLAPEQPTPWILVAALTTTPIALVWALIIRAQRRAANRRLGGNP